MLKVLHIPAAMLKAILFDQRQGSIDLSPSCRDPGEAFVENPFHPFFLDPPDILAKGPFTYPQNPTRLFLRQPSFLPFVPRLFKAPLPDLLQHGRSVHRGASFDPLLNRTTVVLQNRTGYEFSTQNIRIFLTSRNKVVKLERGNPLELRLIDHLPGESG